MYWSLDLLSFSFISPTNISILMPASPIQGTSRPGLERVRNALALTAARKLAMVSQKPPSFKHQQMTEYDHQIHRRPPQHPLLPLLGTPSSKLSKMSSFPKRTSLSFQPLRHAKLDHFLALYNMMSPKSSWESLRYAMRKIYRLVLLIYPNPPVKVTWSLSGRNSANFEAMLTST